jgi:hypothetical protein
MRALPRMSVEAAKLDGRQGSATRGRTFLLHRLLAATSPNAQGAKHQSS